MRIIICSFTGGLLVTTMPLDLMKNEDQKQASDLEETFPNPWMSL